MSRPTLSETRNWNTFWSTVLDGERIRHQVQFDDRHKVWKVRTWYPEFNNDSYGASIEVPVSHAVLFRKMVYTWTNIDEEKNPLYPPGYPGGFYNLKTEPAVPKDEVTNVE